MTLNGEPLEGAEVLLSVYEVGGGTSWGEVRDIAKTVSGPDGSYDLSGVALCMNGRMNDIHRLKATAIVDPQIGGSQSKQYGSVTGHLRCTSEVQVFDFEFIYNP